MATKLVDTELDEVSLVDVGANKHAKVLLYKMADNSNLSAEEVAALKSLAKALTADDDDITKTATKGDKQMDADISKKLDGIADLIKSLDTRIAAVEKSEAKMTDTEKAYYDMLGDDDKAKFAGFGSDERQKMMTANPLKKNDPIPADDDKEGDEGVLKSLNSEARKFLESKFEVLEKALTQKEDVIKKLQKDTEDLQKRNTHLEFQKKAEKELGNLGGTLVEKADALEVIEALPKEQQAYFKNLIKTANGLMGNQFNEVGSSVAKEGSAMDKVAKRAEELQKADSKLTKEQAINKAILADSSLYAEYLAETSAN